MAPIIGPLAVYEPPVDRMAPVLLTSVGVPKPHLINV